MRLPNGKEVVFIIYEDENGSTKTKIKEDETK